MNSASKLTGHRWLLRFLDGHEELRRFDRDYVSSELAREMSNFVSTGRSTKDGVPIFQQIRREAAVVDSTVMEFSAQFAKAS